MLTGLGRTLPDLEGFCMIGQWVDPGGLPVAATSGRNVVRTLCRHDRRPSGITVPQASMPGNE
jgi:hypothetical protein